MLLFKRLPFRRPTAGSILDTTPAFDVPVLAARAETLDRVVRPEFEKLDLEALLEQTRHRRLQLLSLVLAALASVFGAVQAMVAERDDYWWPGAAVAVIGLAAAAVTRYANQTAPMSKYLDSRARAEELRSLYFRYLGGLDGDDERSLEARVVQIVDPLGGSTA